MLTSTPEDVALAALRAPTLDGLRSAWHEILDASQSARPFAEGRADYARRVWEAIVVARRVKPPADRRLELAAARAADFDEVLG